MCVCVWTHPCGPRNQRKTSGILLYCSPPYLLKTNFFIYPEPHYFRETGRPVSFWDHLSSLPNAQVTGTRNHAQLYNASTQCWSHKCMHPHPTLYRKYSMLKPQVHAPTPDSITRVPNAEATGARTHAQLYNARTQCRSHRRTHRCPALQ